MYIYVFGSLCRGEIDSNSDVDLLIISNKDKLNDFDKTKYSLYTQERVLELWKEGNPFAWHLFFESKMIFSADKTDFIQSIGEPQKYRNALFDCKKFYSIFQDSRESLNNDSNSAIFDLSSIFLCIRNIATCFSFYKYETPIFSRNSAFMIDEHSLCINKSVYNIYERSRIISTRGLGDMPSREDILLAKSLLTIIDKWMIFLIESFR